MKKLLLTGFAAWVLPLCGLNGATLVVYNFSGAPGNQAAQAPASGWPATNVIATNITRGAGVVAENGVDSINSLNWSMGSLISGDYYEVTISPAAGYKLSLDSLNFAERRSATGIRDFELRSSLDGYTTALITVNVPDNDSFRNHSLPLPSDFDSLETSVTFRLFGYNAEAANGTWRLSNNTAGGGVPLGFSILGEVSPVSAIPEPGSAVALGVLLTSAVGLHRRRKNAALVQD